MMLELASGKARLLITILITSFNAAQGQRGLTELSQHFLEMKAQAYNVSNAHETKHDITRQLTNNKQQQTEEDFSRTCTSWKAMKAKVSVFMARVWFGPQTHHVKQ